MMNAADTGFVLVSAMLVMLMVPALALFYGGLVASRNVLSTTMHSFVLLGVGALLWPLVGYTLAFGPDVHGLIGGFEHLFLRGVGMEPSEGSSIPALAFMAFQCMFAALTPALISGAYAERIHFQAMLLFSTLWLIVVYCPMAHWVWGGGWLMKMGALDFAGGAVVHMSSGSAALAAAVVLGRRTTMGRRAGLPHNIPMTVLGAGLLWFGWFGFNAGGAYAADGLAAYAFTNTTIAGSIAMIVWMLYDWHYDRKPSFSGVLVGAVAGLATITPCAGYVEPWAAIIIGAVGSSVCYYAKYVQERLGFDDALEVWRAHGMGGVTGALLLGILASSNIDKVNASIHQFLMQLLGVIIVAVYSFVVTIIIFKVISAWGPIRVTKEEEEAGLDESLHGEEAYKM